MWFSFCITHQCFKMSLSTSNTIWTKMTVNSIQCLCADDLVSPHMNLDSKLYCQTWFKTQFVYKNLLQFTTVCHHSTHAIQSKLNFHTQISATIQVGNAPENLTGPVRFSTQIKKSTQIWSQGINCRTSYIQNCTKKISANFPDMGMPPFHFN